MTIRNFDDGFWTSPSLETYSFKEKAFYAYLWTNKSCNPAGLYQITLKTIASETGLDPTEIPELFEALEAKVKWYPEKHLVWVKNFIRRQSNSPKFFAAAARALSSIKSNGAIKELLEYNLSEFEISIPYRYPINTLSIPSVLSCTDLSCNNGTNIENGNTGMGGEDFLSFGSFLSLDDIPAKEKKKAEYMWQAVLEMLKGRVTKANFKQWLEPCRGVLYQNNEFFVGAPSNYVREYLEKNQRSLIETKLSEFADEDVSAHFRLVEEAADDK